MRGRAWSCAVVRAWSVIRGRVWSCVVVRGRSCAVGRVRSCRSARFAASTTVLPASPWHERTKERTNERTTYNNPLNPPGVGWVNFCYPGESIYGHMRAKFGSDPTAGSKMLSFKCISRCPIFHEVQGSVVFQMWLWVHRLWIGLFCVQSMQFVVFVQGPHFTCVCRIALKLRGSAKKENFPKSEITMEVGGWVQVSLWIFFLWGKSSQNSRKPVVICWSSIPTIYIGWKRLADEAVKKLQASPHPWQREKEGERYHVYSVCIKCIAKSCWLLWCECSVHVSHGFRKSLDGGWVGGWGELYPNLFLYFFNFAKPLNPLERKRLNQTELKNPTNTPCLSSLVTTVYLISTVYIYSRIQELYSMNRRRGRHLSTHLATLHTCQHTGADVLLVHTPRSNYTPDDIDNNTQSTGQRLSYDSWWWRVTVVWRLMMKCLAKATSGNGVVVVSQPLVMCHGAAI